MADQEGTVQESQGVRESAGENPRVFFDVEIGNEPGKKINLRFIFRCH